VVTGRRSRRAPACALALALLAAACSSGGGGSAQPTTTTAGEPSSTTTTAPTTTGSSTTTTIEVGPSTTLGGDQGFQPRTPGTLTVGVESIDPPYYQGTTPETVAGGFEYDLAHAIAARLRLPRAVFVRSQFYEMASGPDCRCDILLSHVPITDPRARQVDFTQPYLAAVKAVLVRSATTVRTPEQARALRWAAVIRDTTSVALLTDKVKPVGEPQLFIDFPSALAALGTGQVDAVLYDAPAVMAQAFTDPRVVVAGKLETNEQYATVLRLGSANTTELDDIVSGLKADGTITRLAQRWFGTDPADLPVLPL
jgi:ABC-type amino acid transport substrate-binding protein